MTILRIYIWLRCGGRIAQKSPLFVLESGSKRREQKAEELS